MRRIAAGLLLFLFGALLPSATVMALAAPAEMLPACCRAHGAHHCILMAMGGGLTAGSAPGFHQPACPYRQGLQAVTSGSVTAASQSASSFTLAIAFFCPLTWSQSLSAHRFDSAAPRGPPSYPHLSKL